MKAKVIEHIRARFISFADLANELTEELLIETIPVEKHKTLKNHLWCVVGARESYTKALRDGEWSGFSCSLHTVNREEVIKKLDESAKEFDATVNAIDDWTPTREELLINLLEHETMHEGQMIRHLYGIERTIPSSWKWA